MGLGLRRRRLLPPRARAEAARPARPLAALGGRVQGRRPAPGLRLPALARGRGRDREARRRRRAVRLPAPADRAAAALVRARLRGRDSAVRVALGGRRDRARRVRVARARVRPRRGVRVDGVAGDRFADADPARAAGARLPVRPRTVGRAARLDRGRLAGDDPRPPELLGARRDRPRRLPGRARAARPAARRQAHRRRSGRDRRPGGARGRVAPADRARDRLAQPVAGGAEPRLRRLRERAGCLQPAQLPACARALRPRGRDRRRLAPAAAAGRLRAPADVGRIRARLDAGDLRGHAAAVRLPALRRRDLDLPGPKDHRLRAAAVRARRRDAGARGLPAPVGAAGRARRRESRCSCSIRATSACPTDWWTARRAG